MDRFFHVASIIFVNRGGKLILQKRDDKPGIRNPGMITAWGGAVEGDETPMQAALREVEEETNLRPQESDFEQLRDYEREYEIDGKRVVNHVFLLRYVNEKSLEIYEGQGFVIVDTKSETENLLFTNLTKEIIADFNSKYASTD